MICGEEGEGKVGMREEKTKRKKRKEERVKEEEGGKGSKLVQLWWYQKTLY